MATLGTKLVPTPDFTVPNADAGERYRKSTLPVVRTTGFRKSLFIAADVCCIASGAFLAIALRFPQSHSYFSIAEHLGITGLFAALIILICQTQSLYSEYQPLSWATEFTSISKSILLATVLLGCTLFITGVKSTSRLIVSSTALYSVVTMTAWRQVRRRNLRKAAADGLSCHNVLIVGTDHLSTAVAQHLNLHRQFGFVVLGHLTEPNSPVAAMPSEEEAMEGTEAPLTILGPVSELKTLCRAHFIDEIVVCAHHRATVMQVIADARECGVGVRVIPDLYDGLAWGARLDYLGDFPTLAVVNRSTPALAMTAKRVLDVVGSACGLLFLSPLLLLLAVIVKLDSPGPVFYASKRVGKKGRIFECLKFRSMVVDAEAQKAKLAHLNERDGILFKITKDPRITRAGAFLRKHSLDELPQLWNVLRGDMSLVGPRPPLASEVRNYQLEYLRRLDVAPGITGLWQVEARNESSFERYIALDLKYVENWSLGLDLSILARTVAVVLAGTGS